MVTLSRYEAYKLAKKAGIKFQLGDSDKQDTSAMSELRAIAKLAGYHKPKNASGSTGRYFFYNLLKLKKKRGWK